MRKYKHTHVLSCGHPIIQLSPSLLSSINKLPGVSLLGLPQFVLIYIQTSPPEQTCIVPSHHPHHLVYLPFQIYFGRPHLPEIPLVLILWYCPGQNVLALGGWFHQHVNMLVMSSDFHESFHNYCVESRDGYFFVINTFPLT